MAVFSTNGTGGGVWSDVDTYAGPPAAPPNLATDTVVIDATDVLDIDIPLDLIDSTLITIGTGVITVNATGSVNSCNIAININEGLISDMVDTCANNSGTIKKNSGTVADNYGDIADNGGTVTLNASGYITDNYGVIDENRTGATVETNYLAGLITLNSGEVLSNYGIVDVNASGGVVTNYYLVVTNDSGGVVTGVGVNNITNNSGDVVCSAGTIITEQVTGTLTGIINVTTPWNITVGDFTGATELNIRNDKSLTGDSQLPESIYAWAILEVDGTLGTYPIDVLLMSKDARYKVTGYGGARIPSNLTTSFGPFPASATSIGPFPVTTEEVGPYPVEVA